MREKTTPKSRTRRPAYADDSFHKWALRASARPKPGGVGPVKNMEFDHVAATVGLLPKEVQPVEFEWQEGGGKHVTRALFTGYVGPILINDDVLAMLNEAALTGWNTYRVTVSGPDGKPLSGYHGLGITGRIGPIPWERSPKAWRQAVPEGEPYEVYVGMPLDRDTWDGSDLFVPENTLFKIATGRARRAMETAFPRLFEFTSIEEFEMDASIV